VKVFSYPALWYRFFFHFFIFCFLPTWSCLEATYVYVNALALAFSASYIRTPTHL